MNRWGGVCLLLLAAVGGGQQEEIDVTLVTHATLERLWVLPMICERWRGPISAAVNVDDEFVQFDLFSDLPEACKHIRGGEQVRGLVRVVPVEWRSGDENYPVNKLRNVAMMGVTTSHFLMLDVDFWPSSNLYSTICKYAPLVDQKTALVVPAFSRRG